jgi:hypothetical protein
LASRREHTKRAGGADPHAGGPEPAAGAPERGGGAARTTPPPAARADLLVAAPLRLEARLISSAAPALRVRRTGAGRRHARRRASALALAARRGPVLVLGFGGGLDPAALPGEAVVAERILGPQGEQLALSGAPQLASFLRSRGVQARTGTVASVARPALGRSRRRLRREGACVADMESLWLLSESGGVGAGAVRIVADTASSGLWRPWRGLRNFAQAARGLRRCAVALQDWDGPDSSGGQGID